MICSSESYQQKLKGRRIRLGTKILVITEIWIEDIGVML